MNVVVISEWRMGIQQRTSHAKPMNSGQMKSLVVQVKDILGYIINKFTVIIEKKLRSVAFFHVDNRCPPVPKASNAAADTSLAVQGTVVTYSCLPGYNFTDESLPSLLECDGKSWVGVTPSCERMRLHEFLALPKYIHFPFNTCLIKIVCICVQQPTVKRSAHHTYATQVKQCLAP